MHWFSDRWMHAPHWREVFTLGAQAAAALGDAAQHATQLNYLAWVHLVPPDDPETTLRYAARALELATDSGATAQIGWAHQYTGIALRRLGRLDEAATSAATAAEMFKAIGDIDAYCQTLGAVGGCLLDSGHYAEALEKYLERCDLVSDEKSGMTPSVVAISRPISLSQLGECLGLLGRRDEAIAVLTEAIALSEHTGLSGVQANTLRILAAILADDGLIDDSRQAYARAADTFEAIGDTEAAGHCRDLADAAR
jgi:tetratricopeptide (TPR) repeat protein